MKIIGAIQLWIVNAKEKWRALWKNTIIRSCTISVVILTCVSILAIVVSFTRIPPLVPLWFSKPWGADRLAPSLYIILLPLAAIVWDAINMIFALSLEDEYRVYCQLLFLSSFVVTLLSTILVSTILWIIL